MKARGLDFDKCVGFGSDGASTMINKKNRVVARLKDKINHLLTSIYCVAHRTNLTVINVTKIRPCKNMSKEIDALLNSVVVHLKKIVQEKNCITAFERRTC